MGVSTVAKKKAGKPTPGDSRPRPTALTIKGSLEWRAWVERVARHCRTDVAKLVDASIAEYAKVRGFDDPPPER